jgi:hypothetical protein
LRILSRWLGARPRGGSFLNDDARAPPAPRRAAASSARTAVPEPRRAAVSVCSGEDGGGQEGIYSRGVVGLNGPLDLLRCGLRD